MINFIFDNGGQWPTASGNCLEYENTTTCSIPAFMSMEGVEFQSGPKRSDCENFYLVEFSVLDKNQNPFDLVESNILDDVVQGRIHLIFYYRSADYSSLCNLLARSEIVDYKNVTVISPYHFFTEVKSNYLAFDHWLFDKKYEKTKRQNTTSVKVVKTKKLEFKSTTDNTYGRLFASALLYHGILSESFMKYGDPNVKLYDYTEIKNWKKYWAETKPLLELLELQLPYDNYQEGQHAHWSFVLEPSFDKNGFVVKEVFDSISKMHPFVVLSCPFTLKYLQNLGFKTFMPWVDEGYDKIKGDEQRLYHAFNIAFELGLMPIKDHEEMIKEMIPTLAHNQTNLMSSKSKIIEELFSKVKKHELH